MEWDAIGETVVQTEYENDQPLLEVATLHDRLVRRQRDYRNGILVKETTDIRASSRIVKLMNDDGSPRERTEFLIRGSPVLVHRELFKDGNKHGEEIRWHENGIRRSQTFWNTGKRDGTSRCWNEVGALTSTKEFENGHLIRANGQPVVDDANPNSS